MTTVGGRIRHVREERKLTQDRLAELTGISKGFAFVQYRHRAEGEIALQAEPDHEP